MESGWGLLIDLMAILAGAFLLGALMERLRVPAILGYILAGVLLGPGVAGVIQSVDAVRGLAEIGVALLLFSIGLEFSFSQVVRLGRVGLGGGLLQVFLTIGATYGVATAFGIAPGSALALGAVVALGSTVVVLKALKDQGDLDATYGKAATGVLVFQDLAFVPLVLVVSAMGRRNIEKSVAADFGPAAAQAAIIVIAVLVVAIAFVPRLLRSRAMARNRELPILLAITSCMGAAWAAHSIGLSAAIGAFLGGVLMAETPFAAQIRADVGPLKTLFATLFFASVGMLADPIWIAAHAPLVLSLSAAIVIGKSALAFLALRAVQVPTISAIAAGLALAQIGELSFVLLQISRSQNLLDPFWIQATTSASVLTLLGAPILIGFAPDWGRSLAVRLIPERKLELEAERAREFEGRLEGHVIVVGYGEAGRSAADELRESGYEVLILDTDRKLVEQVQASGRRSMIGDATQQDILEHARLDRACGAVVAVSDHRTAALAVSQIRRLAPKLPIVARARYHLFVDTIQRAGADQSVDEETLVGRRLAEEMALQLGGLWDSDGRD